MRSAILWSLLPAVALAAQPLTADETLKLKTKALEEQVTDLKERVLRSKERLRELERRLLGNDSLARTQLVIATHDETGPGFALQSAAFALDGVPITLPFRARLLPGPHQLAVRMAYRGSGLGIFPYHEGYRFNLTSAQLFELEAGHTTQLDVAGYTRLDPTLSAEQRLGIRFELKRD